MAFHKNFESNVMTEVWDKILVYIRATSEFLHNPHMNLIDVVKDI